MIYDMDTGEMITREEFNKRQKARELDEVGEEDDDDEDEDDDDEDEEGDDDNEDEKEEVEKI